MYKWQYKQMKSVGIALDTKEYIAIRNTIIILTKVFYFITDFIVFSSSH